MRLFLQDFSSRNAFKVIKKSKSNHPFNFIFLTLCQQVQNVGVHVRAVAAVGLVIQRIILRSAQF